jgi:hypothetical protein
MCDIIRKSQNVVLVTVKPIISGNLFSSQPPTDEQHGRVALISRSHHDYPLAKSKTSNPPIYHPLWQDYRRFGSHIDMPGQVGQEVALPQYLVLHRVLIPRGRCEHKKGPAKLTRGRLRMQDVAWILEEAPGLNGNRHYCTRSGYLTFRRNSDKKRKERLYLHCKPTLPEDTFLFI